MSLYKEHKKFDLNKIQSKVLDSWEREGVFEKSLDLNKNNKPFVFYEGPPSANGLPGIPHVMEELLKTCFVDTSLYVVSMLKEKLLGYTRFTG